MADLSYCQNPTFTSRFLPSSSSSAGTELKDGDVIECLNLDSKMLFGDTVALEETLIGTQWEAFCNTTEVLDTPDCSGNMSGEEVDDSYGEEVVLDSDDEQTGKTDETSEGNGISKSINGGRIGGDFSASKRGSVGCLRRVARSVHAPSLHAGSSLPAHSGTVVNTDIKSQKKLAIKDDDMPPVKGQFSVDQKHDGLEYDAGMMENIEKNGKSGCKLKVKPDFTVDPFTADQKTSNHLDRTDGGKVLSQLSACDRKLARISKTDSHESGESSQAEAIHIVDQSATWCHKVKDNDEGNECNEKRKLLSAHEKTTGSAYSDSRSLVHNSKDTESGKEAVAESPPHKLEASSIERDRIDMFDIGLGTQIAAEAMEALSNALPNDFNADAAYQDSENTLGDLPEVVIEEQACFGHNDSRKRDFFSSDVAKQLKRKRFQADKQSNKTSTLSLEHTKKQELSTKTKMMRGKSVAEIQLHGGYSICKNERSGRSRSFKSIQQRDVEEVMDRNNSKVDKSSLVEQTSLGTALLQGKRRNTIVHQPRLQASESTLRRVHDPSNTYGEGKHNFMEVSLQKNKSRKTSVYADDTLQGWSIRKKRSKSRSNTFDEARKRKPVPRENTCVKEAALKLDNWSYPRRRRTRRNVLVHSHKTKKPNTVLMENWEEDNEHIRNLKGYLDSKSISFNTDTKTQSQLFERKFEESLLGREFDLPGSVTRVLENGAALSSKSMFSMNRVGAKLGKPAKVGSMSPDVAGNNLKFEVSSLDGNVVVDAVSEHGYPKHPCSKVVPKPSLIKELISLVSPESFTAKDLRRRRSMANVRVLFSQNLDECTIKQQKKILARMGIPIASNSFDATHFIADRFVRTRNMLEAIALGKPVVTHLWLENCRQAGCFIDEKNYILRDDKKEKEIGFSMPVTLAQARHHPLLKGRNVLVTPNVKPEKDVIATLLREVHGQAMERFEMLPTKDIADNLLILSCDEDYEICAPYLEKGSSVYSPELLLNGIVIQKLEYERHQLFVNRVEKGFSKTRPRGNDKLSRSTN